VHSEQRQKPHDQNAPMKTLQVKVSEERDHVLNHATKSNRKSRHVTESLWTSELECALFRCKNRLLRKGLVLIELHWGVR